MQKIFIPTPLDEMIELLDTIKLNALQIKKELNLKYKL